VRGQVLSAREVNGLTLVSLAGEFDVGDRPLLRRALEPSSAATRPDIALDLRHVEFMDCAVVGTLLGISTSVRSAGGCLRLSGLREGPMRLLRVCRLDEVLCVHDTVLSATAAECGLHRARARRDQGMTPTIPRQPARRSATPV